MFGQTDSGTVDCSGTLTAKVDMSAAGWACKGKPEESGVELDIYNKKDCTGSSTRFILGEKSCFGNKDVSVACKDNTAKLTRHTKESSCSNDKIEETVTLEEGKCKDATSSSVTMKALTACTAVASLVFGLLM